MSFPVGWNRKCAVTCNHTLVGSGGVSAFPGLLTEANLPSEMLTSGGGNAAQADGGDIRFSSDSAGASQLACEIELWTQNANPALAKAVIWVNCALSSASDSVVYVWYNAGGAQTQPAANAAFGSQAVWDVNYRGVWHLPNGSSLTANDSTANANTGAITGATATPGKIDGAGNFNGSGKHIIAPFSSSINFSGPVTVEGWVFPNVSNIYQAVLLRGLGTGGGVRQYGFALSGAGTSNIYYAINAGGVDQAVSPGWSVGAWHHIVVTADGVNHKIYIDGQQVFSTANNTTVGTNGSNQIYIGEENTGNNPSNAKYDELRVLSRALSATWITTEYNNQNAPASFWTAGTPGPTGGSTQQQLSMLGCGA